MYRTSNRVRISVAWENARVAKKHSAIHARVKSIPPRRMAAIAVDGVIDVPLDLLMVVVGRSLGMTTTGHTRKHRVVTGIRMAASAWHIVVARRDREPGMVEGRTRPLCGVVTGFACGGEAGGNVVRIGCRFVFGGVARITERGSALIHAIDVTGRACRRSVFAREREGGRIVVESRTRPLGGVVAGITGLRKPGRDVIRVRRRLIFRQMAGDAGGRQRRVLIVDVARQTGNGSVLARQGELRRAVIEGRTGPLRRVVA